MKIVCHYVCNVLAVNVFLNKSVGASSRVVLPHSNCLSLRVCGSNRSCKESCTNAKRAQIIQAFIELTIDCNPMCDWDELCMESIQSAQNEVIAVEVVI